MTPRPGLTPAAVARAGRTVIERDGLDALTMRAVAAELGTAAASLYRHVADRDALLLAILEDLAAGLPVDVEGATPRERLVRRLLAAHEYLGGHVWVLHILVQGELVAVNAFPFSDACLADLLASGLSVRAASSAYRACWHLMVGELLSSHPLRPPVEPTQRSQAMAALDPEEFPALAAVRELGPGVDDFSEAVDALLAVLVDGDASTEPRWSERFETPVDSGECPASSPT